MSGLRGWPFGLCGLALALSSLATAAPAGKPDVVLFFIDNLRADRAGCYGHGRRTTPSLDRLAARGTLFENAFSQATWSLPSYATVFTSLYPPSHKVEQGNQFLGSSFETIASIFRANGYRTAAFVGGGHLHHLFGMQHGFEVYRDEVPFGSFFHTVPAALEWLESAAGTRPGRPPFLLLVHGYDLHAPWRPPLGFAERFDPAYRGLIHDQKEILTLFDFELLSGNRYRDGPPLAERDVEHLRAHYDGAVGYADAWLGGFLSALQLRGLVGNTLFVAASDHGEQLGEGGEWGHGGTVSEETMHVPLVMAGPGIPAGKRVTDVVELIDLAPTLLRLSGVAPCASHQGAILPGLFEGGPSPRPDRAAFCVSQTGVAARTSRWLFELRSDGSTQLRLPGKGADVAAQHRAETRALRSAVDDWLERTWRPAPGKPRPLTGPVAEFYRRLGYW